MVGTKATRVLLFVMTSFLSSVTIVSNAAKTRTTHPKTKYPPTDVYLSDLIQDYTDPTPPFISTTTTSPTAELTTTVSTTSTTATTTTKKPTATSSISQIRPPLDDQNNVVLFTIDTHSSGDGLLEVQFSKDVITKFHDCLCKADTKVCIVITISTTAIDIEVHKLEAPSTSPTYTCSADNNNSFACYRLAASDLSPCHDEDHCVPEFTTYGPGCELRTVDVFWLDSQKVVINVWSRQIKNIFACNSSCPPSTNDHDDDDDVDKLPNVDDSVSPVVIGIIIAGSLIVLIMFTALVVWVLKVRRNSPATAGHPVSGRVTSTDGLIIGQEGDFHSRGNYPVIRENGTLKSKSPSAPEIETNSNEYSNIKPRNKPNRDAANGTHDFKHSNNNNARNINLNSQTGDEHTYSHINETRVINPGEYSTLDDATQYTRTYSALNPPFRDPRLLPPLPIPAKRSSEPLPYYSVAKPFTEFNAPNIDTVSGQYIELINEPNTAQTANENQMAIPEIKDSSHPRDDTQTNQNSDESNKNQNVYFELEKDTLHYASTSVQDLDYCLAGDGVNENNPGNTS